MKEDRLSKILIQAALVAAPLLWVGDASGHQTVVDEAEYSVESSQILALPEPIIVASGSAEVPIAGPGGLESILGSDLVNFINGTNNDVLHGGFTKYAYGQIAEGLLNVCEDRQDIQTECADFIGKIAEAYLELAPADTDNLRNLGHHGNYLSNLNLILGAHKRITGSDEYEGLNERVTRHLANVSRSNNFHFPSYPNETELWPSDQAFVIYTIHLFDQNHGTNISEPLIEGWKNYLASDATHQGTGLPITDITRASAKSNIPSGSGTSYLILYTSEFDPAQAREWWGAYKDDFLRNFPGPVAGFKEYHSGDYGSDVDSGPIILGVGASATAFGIGAARSMGDMGLARELSNLVGFGNIYASFVGGETEKVANDVVAQAVKFNMSTQEENH
ncbi:hypothetical protein ACFL1B_01580 [Nanoarchaeota archaeon]